MVWLLHFLFNLDTELENDAPRELTIQLCDMDNLRNRINEIFHYWRKRNQRYISLK